jgi:NitT/TauT family transport system permease protein
MTQQLNGLRLATKSPAEGPAAEGSPAEGPQAGRPLAGGWIAWPLGLIAAVGLWAALAHYVDKPYVLPRPTAVLEKLIQNAGLIAWHAQATLLAVVAGFAIGFTLAVVLGYLIYRSPTLERLVTPYIVASQAVPIIAIAPLLIIWLGAGTPMKVLAAALIVFFPMLVNTVVGLRSINPAYRELMRALSASSSQTLLKLEIPAAMPMLLAGLRVAVTLSVIGAVVGEFLGSDRGLGTLVLITRGQWNDALTFAALLTLVALALALYGGAAVLERALLRKRQGR